MPQSFKRILVEMRKDEDGWHQKDELTRKRKENAFGSITNALEECRRHNLYTHNRKHHDHTTQGMCCHTYQLGGVFGKQRNKGRGEEYAYNKTYHRDASTHTKGSL